MDGFGNVFVADTRKSALREILAVQGLTSSNSQIATLASGLYFPTGVAVDGSGNVYVAEYFGSKVDVTKAVRPLVAKTITFTAPVTPAAAGTSATLLATASNGDPVVFTVASGPATVLANVITYTGAGTVKITASSAATLPHRLQRP